MALVLPGLYWQEKEAAGPRRSVVMSIRQDGLIGRCDYSDHTSQFSIQATRWNVLFTIYCLYTCQHSCKPNIMDCWNLVSITFSQKSCLKVLYYRREGYSRTYHQLEWFLCPPRKYSVISACFNKQAGKNPRDNNHPKNQKKTRCGSKKEEKSD